MSAWSLVVIPAVDLDTVLMLHGREPRHGPQWQYLLGLNHGLRWLFLSAVTSEDPPLFIVLRPFCFSFSSLHHILAHSGGPCSGWAIWVSSSHSVCIVGSGASICLQMFVQSKDSKGNKSLAKVKQSTIKL